jgi:hypothetical protein
MFNEDNARVKECPTVNEVIKIKTFLQSLKLYKQDSAAIKRRWSSASKLMM